MKLRFTMTWDQEALAKAFGVKPQDIREYLTDGRRASFIIERRLKWAHEGWTLAPSEGTGYDLRDPGGGLWEVRSITKRGVYFNPSNQVGSSRRFHEGRFLDKLAALEGFILADITGFPLVEFYVVPVDFVARWYKERRLGANCKVSRKTFFSSLAPELPRD